jgi:hypothetical protein
LQIQGLPINLGDKTTVLGAITDDTFAFSDVLQAGKPCFLLHGQRHNTVPTHADLMVSYTRVSLANNQEKELHIAEGNKTEVEKHDTADIYIVGVTGEVPTIHVKDIIPAVKKTYEKYMNREVAKC